MKKLFAAAIGVLLLTGCGNSQGSVSSDVDRSRMPAVVFITSWHSNDESGYQTINICGSDGGCYYSGDEEVCRMSWSALVEAYDSGTLTDKMTFVTSVDTEGLAHSFELICNAAEYEDFGLDYPDSLPDVEADTTSVCGLYYTKEGELKSLLIHLNECDTDIEANYPDANEAYEWYVRSRRKQT